MILPTLFTSLAAALVGGAWGLRSRGMDRWLPAYMAQSFRRNRNPGATHLILCIADHYEPDWGAPSALTAQKRVDTWVETYPQLFGRMYDSDGLNPRHTFFYPLETYQSDHLDSLATLCRQGFGEVEVHLHHDGETAESLNRRLLDFKGTLAERHGLLARDPNTGEVRYGFIHGNWALDNSRPDGRWCGVNNELSVLANSGCYADFTLPSAPSPTQTRIINSIYYAQGRPGCCKSHDRGVPVGKGTSPEGALLLIQGPLMLDWQRRKWGIFPRIENGCLQAGQMPNESRLSLWLRAGIGVSSRPDWIFVKLHTHGAPEKNQRVLLGEPMVRFHELLAERARRDPNFHYHYVTAREMYNLVRAAEAGYTGSVQGARDYHLRSGISQEANDLRPFSSRSSVSLAPLT